MSASRRALFNRPGRLARTGQRLFVIADAANPLAAMGMQLAAHQKKKAGGHYAADLVLQLPALGSGSVTLHSVLLD
jgi:hypothetical protein